VIASPRKKRPVNAGLKAEAEVSDPAWASEKALEVGWSLGIETCPTRVFQDEPVVW